MQEIKRSISVEGDLKSKSILLLGPRQTGKTTLLQSQIHFDRSFNLLHADVYAQLAHDPSSLRKSLGADDKLIFVDEIQKLPSLMDEIHSMIEEKKIRFALTGSSARKLRRAYTSLMGGRLRVRNLFPLVSNEIPNFDLNRLLLFGTLPSIYLSKDPSGDLRDYVGTYLKEEIAAEALARNIESFSRFLKVAAASNARQVNYESTGNDSQVPGRTVREYFDLLQDTLVGHLLHPIRIKNGRKTTTKPKFYFFDCGVASTLLGIQELDDKVYGDLFEQFLVNEVKAYLSYSRKLDDDSLRYWRTQRGEFEVDLIVAEDTAIEFKATQKVNASDLRGLKALREEYKLKNAFLVSRDIRSSLEDKIQILSYRSFLEKLWNGEII
ncbi:AAA family ATPase [bacterium]|jgi:predicted AAA+ superfamily ATPase|nr:AAA family ATPase [bacterium]